MAGWVAAPVVLAVLMGTGGCTDSGHPAVAIPPAAVVFAAGGQPPVGADPGQITRLVRHVWAATAAAGTTVLTVHSTDRFGGGGRSDSEASYTGTGSAVLPTAAADLRYRASGNAAWRWRFIGDVLYTVLDLRGTEDSGWARTDLAAPALHRDAGTPVNPVGLLQALSGALTSVTAAGSQSVGGVVTTCYAGTAELAAAAAAAPGNGTRLALRQLERSTGSARLNVLVWIDGAGRLRRLAYTDQLATRADASDESDAVTLQTFTTTITLTRFGVPAAVTAPPRSSPAP